MKNPCSSGIQQITRLWFVSLLAACSWGQTSPPVIAAGGILNAADYGTALAPGAMVSIFGTNLAPRIAAAASVPLPTTLEGVSVEAVSASSVNQLPLYFVSSGQINAQLPYSVVGTTLEIRVRNAAGVSATRQIAIAPRAPRLFTKTMDGKGEAILLHATNYRLVTDLEPATPGEYLILYLTGLGEVSPAVQPGRPGGDGGALGPLNRVTTTVTATLGGVNASVLFAGLAPGFVGVYQLNIQAPANLPAGRPVVSVAAANVTCQANVWISAGAAPASNPEDVLRRALEAQARGDITALLGECSSLDGKPAASSTRKVFEAVQRMAQFSNFRFTHLATAQGDKGTLAAVRAKVDYSVAVRGVVEPLSFGLLGIMKKDGSGWKVAALVPDDLLNLEEFASSSALAAKGVASASALDLKTANQMITDAMKGGYVDEDKLGVAIAMGAVGQFGPAGDLAANSYQFYDTLKNVKDAVSEIWTNGMSPIGYVKAEQVAVGIFQIVSEPVPGMDAFADSVQASLEQFGFNLEIMRGLAQLKLQLYRAPVDGLRFSPQLALLEPFQFNYPAGMENSGDPEIVHAAGTPVRSILFKTSHSVGHRLPLRVLGEMPVEKGSSIHSIAERLGGKLRGTTYYIPVDVTHLVSGELASGDMLLDNYGRYRGEKSGTRVLLWDANCRRGRELLRVSLRNGETTPVVNIVNWFMNVIDDFRLTGLDAGNQFKLKAGEERAFTVTGSSALLSQEFWPNLTTWSACFDMAVRNPAVATLERGAATKLKGVAKGSTELSLLLPGSAGDPGVVDLTRSTPVIVEETDFPTGLRFTAQVSGTQHIRYRNGTAGTTTATLEVLNSAQVPVVWSGGVLTAKGKFIDSGGFRETEIDVSGTLDPAKMMFTQLRATTTAISRGFAGVAYSDTRRIEINATNVPLQSCNQSMSNCTWVLNGTAAAPAVTVKASLEHVADSKLDAAQSWDYVSTDWSSVNAKLYVGLGQ
jgi:uncharacterized protein (TIGR03437 family)